MRQEYIRLECKLFPNLMPGSFDVGMLRVDWYPDEGSYKYVRIMRYGLWSTSTSQTQKDVEYLLEMYNLVEL